MSVDELERRRERRREKNRGHREAIKELKAWDAEFFADGYDTPMSRLRQQRYEQWAAGARVQIGLLSFFFLYQLLLLISTNINIIIITIVIIIIAIYIIINYKFKENVWLIYLLTTRIP